MEYIELKIKTDHSQEKREIAMALLAEAGYESFVEEGDFLLAYIPRNEFRLEAVEEINSTLPEAFRFDYSYKIIADKNWNAVWEKNYSPVLIGEKVYIRAPFHPKNESAEYEIVIEPKMSFGTAHHPTTSQIIKLMNQQDFTGKIILDMGCGTSVLAIFASMLKAKLIDAVDNDEWAYGNSVENVERNHRSNINLYLNDASFLDASKDNYYDIIIANINRNILLNDLPKYTKSLKKGGTIFMSGFYEKDLELIGKKAADHGLEFESYISEHEWIAAKWIKN